MVKVWLGCKKICLGLLAITGPVPSPNFHTHLSGIGFVLSKNKMVSFGQTILWLIENNGITVLGYTFIATVSWLTAQSFLTDNFTT